jgi:Immunity protein Imm1
MTVQGTIQWGQNDVAVVDSPDAFNDLITRLQVESNRHPTMIDVIAGDGRSLTLGLGRDMTIVSLAGPEGSPPYYASVGNENAKGDITFDYHGEMTEFPLHHAVSFLAARKAALQFLSESGLPNAVRWKEV